VTRVAPLRREDLPQYDDLYELYEQTMGFVPNSFLVMARRPEILDGFRRLIQAVWHTGTVDPQLKPMIALMASYAAGCQYCQAHEAARSKMGGVADDKIAAIWDFENSPLFSPAEKSALRLARDAAQQPNAATSGHFDELRRYYSEEEIVEIMAVIAAFGFLNRWNDTLATDLEQIPTEIAERTLGGLRWEPGKHAT
jgi:uncharacterized peroxidase-related enzyme